MAIAYSVTYGGRIWPCPDCKEWAHFFKPCSNCGFDAPGFSWCARAFGILMVAALLTGILWLLASTVGRLGEKDEEPSEPHSAPSAPEEPPSARR